MTFWNGRKIVEPAYTVYDSLDLGVTVVFPNNIVSLDNTQRRQRKLVFLDPQGVGLITVTRRDLPDHQDPKTGRENELAKLAAMNVVVTYIAPEKEQNWSNWYVLSGLDQGTEFYFRRWYTPDSIVMYGKELAPLFDKIIPTMTHEFSFRETAPKTTP